MSSAAGASPNTVSRIALVGVDAASAAVLTECFRQFGMEVVGVPADESSSVGATYNACVVPLTAEAEAVLRCIRQAGGPRTVVYGMCGSIREAVRFSEFGINAVFQTPVRKQEALLVVRATHLLVMKELRRSVRVPLVSAVTLKTEAGELEGNSVEISARGMSVALKGQVSVPQTVLASFTLPGMGVLSVQSVVCWSRQEEGTAAIRFDPSDPQRLAVHRWIDEYLGD